MPVGKLWGQERFRLEGDGKRPAVPVSPSRNLRPNWRTHHQRGGDPRLDRALVVLSVTPEAGILTPGTTGPSWRQLHLRHRAGLHPLLRHRPARRGCRRPASTCRPPGPSVASWRWGSSGWQVRGSGRRWCRSRATAVPRAMQGRPRADQGGARSCGQYSPRALRSSAAACFNCMIRPSARISCSAPSLRALAVSAVSRRS